MGEHARLYERESMQDNIKGRVCKIILKGEYAR